MWLGVQKDETIKYIDKNFNHVTYHLYCMKCGKKLDLTYADLKVSTKDYLNQGIDEYKILNKKELTESETVK